MDYRSKRPVVSPVRETQIQLHAAVLRSRKLDLVRAGLIHLEPMPPEPCGRTYDGNDYCTRPDGHKGPCNVKPPGEVDL